MMKKNLTPKQLAWVTALILSVPVSLGIYYLRREWEILLISFVVVLTGSYFLIHFIIDRFVYRKLKLIYKFIYQTKASKKQETYYKYVLPDKSLDEVTEDVKAWGEQQKNEIELLRNNELFRKEFLQNLSHEFKTPVFAIQGYIETLLGGAMDEPETSRRFLEKASKNIQRLSNLIQDLDQISKLERGEIELDKRNFFIQDLVKEVFDSFDLHAQKKNIILSIKKGCEQLIPVYADKDKIRQVLTNLVENAIKYSGEGSNTVASIYDVEGKNILVEIGDEGIGIAEENLPRIFERFYRTEEGRSRDVTGSGLGLAICKHIIEAHGHSMHVRSREGVGTTIGFTIDARIPH
jgi:two-component system, OmpR family, phosphate regulon sensor histidine kinase PhoR